MRQPSRPSPPVRPAPPRPGRVAARRMRQATERARAPVVLAALEDRRVQLKLLNLRVALDGPCVISCESLFRGVLVDCGSGDGSGRGVPRQQQSPSACAHPQGRRPLRNSQSRQVAAHRPFRLPLQWWRPAPARHRSPRWCPPAPRLPPSAASCGFAVCKRARRARLEVASPTTAQVFCTAAAVNSLLKCSSRRFFPPKLRSYAETIQA